LDTPISVVELKIESNAGNKDYTCLYKFRVHGKLYSNKNTNDANQDGEEKKDLKVEKPETNVNSVV
jgi:hypothetical protein